MFALKKKLKDLKSQVEAIEVELGKIDGKFDNIVTQAEIYKSKVEREMGREIRRLQKELQGQTKGQTSTAPTPTTSEELHIATTLGIFESVLRLVGESADDFRLISYAFLFPSVYERVVSGGDDTYYLTEVPASASVVVERGRKYVSWLRSEYDTHLTHPSVWSDAIDYIAEWWRNDALPLLYGCRDEQWDIDMPLSLAEMVAWRDTPSERSSVFPDVTDGFEILQRNKEAVYDHSGLREFEIKHFKFN